MKKVIIILAIAIVSSILLSAAFLKPNATEDSSRKVSEQAKTYWYDGKAEISSFKLTQARYGEIHNGTTVLVYVTEPFSKASNTKADYDNQRNIPVLKLNTSKKFVTGIYPYSLMNTTFYPFENGETSLKIASSIQEWCGMAYLEMKQDQKLIFNLNSYFEGRSFKNKEIDKALIEDDLWSLIRLNPELLPIGKHEVIPSMFYLLLKHKAVQAVTADLSISDTPKGDKLYTISYPALKRTIAIQFSANFPHSIVGWEETYPDGYGLESAVLKTKAELIKTIKSDYWNKSRNKDEALREQLGL